MLLLFECFLSMKKSYLMEIRTDEASGIHFLLSNLNPRPNKDLYQKFRWTRRFRQRCRRCSCSARIGTRFDWRWEWSRWFVVLPVLGDCSHSAKVTPSNTFIPNLQYTMLPRWEYSFFPTAKPHNTAVLGIGAKRFAWVPFCWEWEFSENVFRIS